MRRVTPQLRAYRAAIRELEQAWRNPHHECCGRCHAVSFMALLEGDTEDILLATRMCQEHARSGVDFGMPKCEHDGCAYHEEISFPVARRLLTLNRGEMGGEDGRGRKIATFELICREDDRPAGITEEEAGTVFLRYTRRKVTAHVWPQPPEEGDHETHPLEAIAHGWDRHFVACRDWCLNKYREARGLAEADLELDLPKRWELRAPFGKRRTRSRR